MEQQIVPPAPVESVLSPEAQAFEFAQRKAKLLASSDLIPKAFQNNIPNCVIALEMSRRVGLPAMMVCQNLNIIQGRPTWAASFIAALILSSKRFTPPRYIISKLGKAKVERGKDVYEFEDMSCHVECETLEGGHKLEGPPVTMTMAYREGWIFRDGSKWKTLPGLMMRWRAVTWFGRLHCPDLLCGLHTDDEVETFSKSPTRRPTLRKQADIDIEPPQEPPQDNASDPDTSADGPDPGFPTEEREPPA